MSGFLETTLVNESKLNLDDEVNIPKLLTLRIHFYLILVSRFWTQTDCDVIFTQEDCLAITQNIEHVEKSFQVVTYSTICTGQI